MAITEPATVERDDMGFWTHPDLPVYEEGDTPKETVEQWSRRVGIEIHRVDAEDDMDEEAFEAVCDGGGCLSWEPSKPAGDGWHLIAIKDTEDGPMAWWARPVKEAA